MTATPANIDQNRAEAHYPADVTTPRRRRKAELTPEQEASIARVRAAAQALETARKAMAEAKIARREAVRKEWPILRTLGPTRVAREVGEDLLGEGTVRGDTDDLRARERAQAE